MDSLINRCPIIATLFKDEILQKIKYIEHINAILPLFKNDVASQSIILFTAADNETNINFKYFSKEAFTEEVLVKLLSHWDFAKDLQRAGIPISSSVIEKALPHNLDLVYSLMKNPELINYKIASYYVENSNVSSYDQFMSCLPKSQLSEKEIYWIAKKVITEIPSEVAWIYQYVTTEGKKQNRLWNEALLIDPSVIKEITSSDEIMHDQDLLLDIVERAVNYHCDRLSRKEKSTLQLKDIPMMIFNYDTKKFQPALHENDIIDACVRMIVWDSGTINDVPEQYRQIVQKEVDEELEKSKYY
jgi:hypothetical protein